MHSQGPKFQPWSGSKLSFAGDGEAGALVQGLGPGSGCCARDSRWDPCLEDPAV